MAHSKLQTSLQNTDHIHGKAVQAEYMEQDQLSSLFSSGELGERYKMDHLAEAVHDGQDDSVAVRGGKTSNKVQRYV